MSPRRRNIHPEIARVLERLKIAIQALGYSMRDIEKRLKTSDGYLSRVFLGAIELKMEHIVFIAAALQMAPEELMAFVYPKPKEPMSPAAYELWRRVGGAPPSGLPGSPKPSEGGIRDVDVEGALRRTLGTVLSDLAAHLSKPKE